MANWYVSRDAFKRAAKNNDAERDSVIDRHIETASRQIDQWTRRFFIPKTETRLYRWPPSQNGSGTVLWVDEDLLSVSTLQSEAQNTNPTTIASTDYFLEPANSSPYNRIEIDLSSTAAFSAGDTPQRSISVAGSWGYSNDTQSVGTVASGLASSASATSMVCSDASVIDVGDTLLIESEQIFVSDRDFAALGSILVDDASITSDMSDNVITVDGSHGIVAGETIRLDSERMLVLSVSTNDLTVVRAYDGSVLATHADNTAVNINRTLTIERGVNGTTAATHANSTAISKYEPPFDITSWCMAEAIAMYHQEGAGWGRTIGQGEGTQEMTATGLTNLRKQMVGLYRRHRSGVI